jgi:predicted NBD/HSP70 family sugar kinase
MFLEEENQQTITSRYYRAVVLAAIRRYKAISRIQLQKITKIRLASISDLVKDLIDEGLIEEAGVGESIRGRKQKMLRLSSCGGFVIGVEFDVNRVIALAVNLNSQVVGQSQRALVKVANRKRILNAIDEAVRDVLAQAGGDRSKLIGIGVADPGVIDSKKGLSIFSSTIADWRDVPLKAILEEAFGVPVMMESNTRTKTLCEKRFGEGKDAKCLMFVEFGSGIGCGLMNGDELYRGFTESAGELGHIRVRENGPVCNCGSYGCLETQVSLPALASQAVRAMKEGAVSRILELAGGEHDAVTAEHVFEAARQGDKLALGILDKAAEYLGVAVAGAINLFNPEMVVFNWRFGQVAELLLDTIKRIIQRQALAVATRDLKLAVSKIGEEAGALGAAVMVLDKVFEIPQLSMPEFMM